VSGSPAHFVWNMDERGTRHSLMRGTRFASCHRTCQKG
jgi:hypothetical protein